MAENPYRDKENPYGGFANPGIQGSRDQILEGARSEDPIASMHSAAIGPAAEEFRLNMREALSSRIRASREQLLAGYGPGQRSGGPAAGPSGPQQPAQTVPPSDTGTTPPPPRETAPGEPGYGSAGGFAGSGAGIGRAVGGISQRPRGALDVGSLVGGRGQPNPPPDWHGPDDPLEEAIGGGGGVGGWLSDLWDRLFGDDDEDDLPAEKSRS